MAVTNYSSLKAAIISWLNRDDLSTEVDTFIDLAEAHFNRELRLLAQESALGVTLSGGLAAIPADYLELKSALITGTPTRALEILPLQELYRQYPTRSSTSKPFAIAREGGSFVFGPFPDSDYVLSGVYYSRFTALDDNNPTNWLITNAPDLYLYRSLMEAEGYVGNDARLALWSARAIDAEERVKSQDRRETYPAHLPLRMRSG